MDLLAFYYVDVSGSFTEQKGNDKHKKGVSERMPVPVVQLCLVERKPVIPEVNRSMWHYAIFDPRQHVDIVVPQSMRQQVLGFFIQYHIFPAPITRRRRKPRRDFPRHVCWDIMLYEFSHIWIHSHPGDFIRVDFDSQPIGVFFDERLESTKKEEHTAFLRIGRPFITRLNQMRKAGFTIENRFELWHAK